MVSLVSETVLLLMELPMLGEAEMIAKATPALLIGVVTKGDSVKL